MVCNAALGPRQVCDVYCLTFGYSVQQGSKFLLAARLIRPTTDRCTVSPEFRHHTSLVIVCVHQNDTDTQNANDLETSKDHSAGNPNRNQYHATSYWSMLPPSVC